MNFIFCSFLYILLNSYHQVFASNILVFHSISTASHRTSIWPLIERLGDAGHNITYIFPVRKQLGTHPQVKELKPSKMLAAVEEFVEDFDINIRLNNKQDEWLQVAFLKCVDFCEAFYDSPETQELLNSPGIHFDLIMMDGVLGSCAYGLVHKFQAKQIMFNPATMPFHWDPFGIVPETSTVPEFMFHRKPADLMTSLWSRIVNTLSIYVWRQINSNVLRSMEQIARKKLNLTGMPSFEEIERETDLVLHNTYFIEDYPMSLPPMFVSYSGLLCTEKDRKQRKPLPTDLENFVGDNNSDGFIYVSFGSAVMLSAMPEHVTNQFFEALAQFPKLRFLLKWKGERPENATKNIMLQSWYPQKDVLAHPKIKAFIFQAGRPSTQEALCYGVPMITLPVFGDQDFNAHRLEQIGASVLLEFSSIATVKLANAIRKIVGTDKYKNWLTELSTMFRDRPNDPVENAYYWVEYMMKYNTSLLKQLGRHQTWWQRRLLDVYALIFAILLVVLAGLIGLLILLAKFAIWLMTGNRVSKQKIYTKTE